METTPIPNPPRLPPRSVSGHKGLFGRLLIVGGSDEMIGAPVLAATAALRTGSGLVQVAMPRTVLAAALSVTPEVIGLGLDKRGGKQDLIAAAEKADAVVIGPGLGTSPDATARLGYLVRLDKRMVVDADGLNILAEQSAWPTWFKAHAVLTPHPGEMTRLAKLLGRGQTPSDEQGRIETAQAAAHAFRQCLVLKGERTIVTDGPRLYINQTGNSALSKAGSGDVLSGILGSLLGLGMERFEAACAAVCLHGLAGEAAGAKFGLRSPLARDVIDAIPEAIREYEKRSVK